MILHNIAILCDDIIIYILDKLAIPDLLKFLITNKYNNNYKNLYLKKIDLGKVLLIEYNLTGYEREFSNIKYMSGIHLTHFVSNIIYILPDLQGLYLTHSSLNDLRPIINAINDNRIEKIYFGWNIFSDISPVVKLFKFDKFKQVYLSGNNIENIDYFCENLCKSYITHLSLSFNKITNIDKLIDVLSYTKITNLDLSGNKITNINLDFFANSLKNSKLERLSIWNNPMSPLLYENLKQTWINSGKKLDKLFVIFR